MSIEIEWNPEFIVLKSHTGHLNFKDLFDEFRKFLLCLSVSRIISKYPGTVDRFSDEV